MKEAALPERRVNHASRPIVRADVPVSWEIL